MLVVDTKNVNLTEDNGAMVNTGPILRSLLIDGKSTGGYSSAVVKYLPGAKLNWHIHDSEQIIFGIEGKGVMANEKEENIVTPGVLVVVPAGELHYHGAYGDNSFTHIAFYSGSSKVIK